MPRLVDRPPGLPVVARDASRQLLAVLPLTVSQNETDRKAHCMRSQRERAGLEPRRIRVVETEERPPLSVVCMPAFRGLRPDAIRRNHAHHCYRTDFRILAGRRARVAGRPGTAGGNPVDGWKREPGVVRGGRAGGRWRRPSRRSPRRFWKSRGVPPHIGTREDGRCSIRFCGVSPMAGRSVC